MKPVHAITPPAGTLCGTDPYGTITEDPKAVTCPVCRSKGGGDPPEQPVHLTTDQGYTIACEPNSPRAAMNPMPAIVELANYERITCPDCMRAMAVELDKLWNGRGQAEASRTPEALERIATALERIAQATEKSAAALDVVAIVLENPHDLASAIGSAVARHR